MGTDWLMTALALDLDLVLVLVLVLILTLVHILTLILILILVFALTLTPTLTLALILNWATFCTLDVRQLIHRVLIDVHVGHFHIGRAWVFGLVLNAITVHTVMLLRGHTANLSRVFSCR